MLSGSGRGPRPSVASSAFSGPGYDEEDTTTNNNDNMQLHCDTLSLLLEVRAYKESKIGIIVFILLSTYCMYNYFNNNNNNFNDACILCMCMHVLISIFCVFIIFFCFFLCSS